MKNLFKNKKAKIVAVGAILVIAILAIIILALNIDKNNNEVTEPLVREEDGLPLTLTEENLNEMIDYMNSYDEIVLHYNVFEYIYNENEEYLDTNNITGISSKVNILTLDELTIDSDKIFIDKEEGYEPTDEEVANATLSFEEVFGVNYKDYDNVYDLICDVVRTQGALPESFVGSEIDVQMYDSLYDEENRRKYYYYENENFDPQIEDYDEIISKYLRVITNKDNFGKEYISDVDAIITYKKNGKIIKKYFETNIWLMMTDEMINLEESTTPTYR